QLRHRLLPTAGPFGDVGAAAVFWRTGRTRLLERAHLRGTGLLCRVAAAVGAGAGPAPAVSPDRVLLVADGAGVVAGARPVWGAVCAGLWVVAALPAGARPGAGGFPVSLRGAGAAGPCVGGMAEGGGGVGGTGRSHL